MEDLAKQVILIGISMMFFGAALFVFGKFMGKLPGDIVYKKENMTFYFPLATCIFISLLISLILYFFNQK